MAISSFAPAASHATAITLSAARDNTLIESATGANSNALGSAVFAGRTAQGANSVRRAVIAFDIAAAIPAGSIIESVTLSLTRTGGNSSPTTLALHRLLSDWGEGTSLFDG
ncbi:MAG: DNRLRE domain-containing protein, partial [Myxococcota bacterium]